MSRPIELDRVKIGLVQTTCSDDTPSNLSRTVAAIRRAAARGAQIVCLQELFRSTYFCQTEDADRFDLAEPIPGESTALLGALAAELGIVIVASLFEARAEGLYHNTAVVLDADGSIAGIYRKMHIPDDPLYYEKFYFTPGDTGFRAFDTAFGRIGVLVCWDQWFPEAARLTALHGASILFYPTAIGWHAFEKDEWGEAQRNAWESIQRSHAIANGVFVAAVNRVGIEGGLQFWGNSFACDPFGRVIVRAEEREETLIAECDMGLLREIRRAWPFLRDRRIDAYGGIMERYLDGRRR